jgi:hypothetical protein
MAALNAWQKIDRVLSGKPFGNGADGAYSSATIPTLVNLSCAGVATETHFHATAANFVANDLVLLYQTRGTGVGQWEINKVTADNGDGTYTVDKALNYTYTDSEASQAQVIKIFQYTNATVETGTWTVPAWDGNIGGILTFAANGTVTVTGTLSVKGGNGAAGSGGGGAGGTGGGFRGGAGSATGAASIAIQGEGGTGVGGASTSANSYGGGGGQVTSGSGAEGGSGGSGGHVAAGTVGGSGTNSNPGAAGLIGASTADLLTMHFGGGGGGGANDSAGNNPGGGGAGGGIALIFAKNLVCTGAITANGGESGGGSEKGYGAAGAGGAVHLQVQTATLGTALTTATGGAASGYAAAGSNGLIAIHHGGTVAGTTNPTFTDTENTGLVYADAGAFFNFI